MPSAKPRSPRRNQLVTARPVAVFVLAPNAPATRKQHDERREARREGGAGQPARRPEQAHRRRRPLADPVGGQPPRKQREHRARARRPPSMTPIWVRLRP